MYLLHGLHGRYLHDFTTNGFGRDTAAFFVYPRHFDMQTLMCSIICAIYHAIGVNVIYSAIIEKKPLKPLLQMCGGVYLTLCFARMTTDNSVHYCKYMMQGVESYPYVKKGYIKKNLMCLGNVKVDDDFFIGLINNESEGRRFFQKKDGVEQCIPNCDMKVLSRMCALAADGVFPKVVMLMEENYDKVR